MAGAKESPRQKMINLMYLVFIAMLALNMSKEVLTAFGLITEQVSDNNQSLQQRIDGFKEVIETNFNNNVENSKENKYASDSIILVTNKFLNYINSVKRKPKQKFRKKIKDSIADYEVMDKPDYFDNLFFIGSQGVLTEEGQRFINEIEAFRMDFTSITRNLIKDENQTYEKIIKDILHVFSTDQVINREGNKVNWIDYHYFGYPEVATNTKLTIMEANALSFQAELFSAMIGGQYKINATLANFEAIVVPDRSAFFTGTNFTGKIILGKKSKDLKPRGITINSNELDPTEALNADGAIVLDFPAGSVGDQTISGEVVFIEDDKPISIPINSTYAVIPEPKTSSIELVGRMSLFRDYNNQVKISAPGIPSNLLTVTGQGITNKGNGEYIIKPTGGGKDLTINISGKLPNGEMFNDKRTFTLRKFPPPNLFFNGKQGGAMSKAMMSTGALTAKYPDWIGFTKSIKMISFKVKIGPKSFKCTGNYLSSAAKDYLKKAPKGFDISFKDIVFNGVSGNGDIAYGPSITIK